jgi:hypothetical protein
MSSDLFIGNLILIANQLRHNYLRVLHPLLTKTQLRDYPYKRPQILYTLESLVGKSKIRDVNPTTKRLVERCLTGDWCVQLRARRDAENASQGSDNSETSPNAHSPDQHLPTAVKLERSNSKIKTLKSSKSVENIKARRDGLRPAMPNLDRLRRASNSSSASLPAIADSKAEPNVPKRRGTAGSTIVGGARAHKHHDRPGSQGAEHDFHTHHHQLLAPADPPQLQQVPLTHTKSPPPPPLQTRTASPLISTPSPTSTTSSASDQPQLQPRRRPPPAPPKRRKPPAVPSERMSSGATITVIRSSEAAGTPLVRTVTPKSASSLHRSTIF